MPFDPRNFGGFGYSSPSRGGGGTVASLGGADTQAGAGAYGGVPTAPSLASAQQAALGADVSQMERIQSIMDQINRQSAQSAMLPLQLNLPNYGAAMGQAMGNVQSYLGGQVPADVIGLMQQQAAERGVATGLPGANIGDAAYLRALGLTSLGLQQQGQQNLTSLMGAVPRGTLMDPSGLLVTPGQTYEAQWLANQLAAAPNPAEAAAAEMAAVQAGMGAGQRGGAGPGGYSITGGPGPSAPFRPSVFDTNVYRAQGPFTSSVPQAYDAWRGLQPSYGVSRPATGGFSYMGAPEGEWPAYENAYWENLISGAPEQDYYDDTGMTDWAAEEAAYFGQ